MIRPDGASPVPTRLLSQLVSREEKAQLKAGGILGVGSVNGIVLDAAGPLLADRALFRIGWVGSPHQLAEIGNRIFFFQGQGHDRTAALEIRERVKERPAGMDGVKLLCLMLGNLQHLHAENVETIFLELFDDIADAFFLYRIRLDDGECALQGYMIFSPLFALGTENCDRTTENSPEFRPAA